MPTKRFALVVRLWQVKDDPALFAANLSELDNASAITVPSPCYHWRGAVQLAGDTRLHYFNSLQEMNHLITQLVEPPAADQP